MLNIEGINGKELQVKVLDMKGEIVYLDKKMVSEKKFQQEVDLGEISAGTYIVIIKMDENIFYKNVMVE